MVCGISDLADHIHVLQIDDPVSDLLNECRKAVPNLDFILERALPKALPKMAIEEVFISLATIASLFATSENKLPVQFFKALSSISSYFFSNEPKYSNRPLPAFCAQDPLPALACIVNSPKIGPKPISGYEACLFICSEFLTLFPTIDSQDTLTQLFENQAFYIKNDIELIEIAALVGLCQKILGSKDTLDEYGTLESCFKLVQTHVLLAPHMIEENCLDVIRTLTQKISGTDTNWGRNLDEFCAQMLEHTIEQNVLTVDEILPVLPDILLANNTSVEIRTNLFRQVLRRVKNRSISITYVASFITSFRQFPKAFVICIQDLFQLKWSNIHQHKELLKQILIDLKEIEAALSYSEKAPWSRSAQIFFIETLVERARILKRSVNYPQISESVSEKNEILRTIKTLYTPSVRQLILSLRYCILSSRSNELHVVEVDNKIVLGFRDRLKDLCPKIPMPAIREKMGMS